MKVIDVGVDHDLSGTGVIDKKIALGTKNMVDEPAMTYDEALQTIQAGYDVAQQAIKEGNDLLLVGELGMGNTTPASAIISVILGVPAEEVVGAAQSFQTSGCCTKQRSLIRQLRIGNLIRKIQLTF